ncbi:ATP-binding protein [Agriterribacter sp.]|uniref:sensor histidine kinase n=1 Tax=Agriterribacter sp. TaxID=2821509 RepID=UPI002B6D58D5|nr:ATP-binding protein [Agriterribacter sp.]HRO46180.1 ATP-binding protein [Agriterribacter sp.]HRQ16294.1 ATP-binding protein [Agriterribacter sp.]
MLTTKNISPRQLAGFTAFFIALPVAAGIFFLKPLWWVFLLAFAIIMSGSYALILYTLQRFIYRKIKLIYKFIYQTKASKREEFYYKSLLPQKSIDEVSADVEKWAEQKKKEIEVLKANEAFRKEFLQNFSHELKTPIFAIQGYIETLLAGAIENPEVSTKFLSNASKNTTRLVNLLSDLDAITKLESGEQILYKENFVVQDLIREVFDSLSLLAAKRDVKLAIKKGCETPITVFADKEKIRQVFINLTDNAIKYGKSSGNVTASAYITDEKHVLVEVSDDGIGISEEHIPRIAERFYRTDAARSRKEGGSGLGLAICKHIIEAHGQSIHIRSKPDVGTTFGFTLNAKKD